LKNPKRYPLIKFFYSFPILVECAAFLFLFFFGRVSTYGIPPDDSSLSLDQNIN